MRNLLLFLLAATAIAGCRVSDQTGNSPDNSAAVPAEAPPITLARLDCGNATIKDFSSFFSDRPGLYAPGARDITDSCYLIQNGGQQMVWDTGFSADLKGQKNDMGPLVATMDKTLAEQLAEVGLKPQDIDIVGISHMHADHTGQAAQFLNANLLIGKRDFEQTAGKDDPFGPWRGDAKPTTLVSADHDVFGDGRVMVLHLPGHTPDHLALLVKLASGPVLLSGDLYHATEARQKRGVPPFNTDRKQTLASMDRFEKLATELGAKVVIQHEPADINKLPAFPSAAK